RNQVASTSGRRRAAITVSFLDSRVERILNDRFGVKPRGIGVKRVEHDVERRGNKRAGNAQQTGPLFVKPRGSYFTSDLQTFGPVRWKSAHVQAFQRNPSVSFHAQQGVVGRNIVRAGMDASLQQSSRRTLCQVDDQHAAFVPATGSPQSTCARQVPMPANPPEDHQTNIPSSIWTRSSSTMRLPVSVLNISKGVRPRRRGWGRRSQASARSRDSYTDFACD